MMKRPKISIWLTSAFLVFALNVEGASTWKRGPRQAAAKKRHKGVKSRKNLWHTMPSTSLPLVSPMRITRAGSGLLAVTDYHQQMVFFISPRNSKIQRGFRVQGRPMGVAKAGGRFYVGNETKARVEVYNRRGRLVGRIGGPAAQVRFFNREFALPGSPFAEGIQKPTDIAVDPLHSRVFVVDGAQKNVKVFTRRGDPLFTIPSSSPDIDILANPTAVAVDPTESEIYVSDYGDEKIGIYARIQIFNYQGEQIGTISGRQGMFGQRFSRPQGLFADGAGHIFLVDCFAAEVLMFDRHTGILLKTLGGHGTAEGKMRLPLDVAVHPRTKDVFVTNNRLSRIERFAGGGQQ